MFRKQLLLLLVIFLAAPSFARAQSAGAIAGVVRDASGGVLPGVTVEAASPALIEKVRTAVSDSAGQYRIVDLPPGTYSVSFTLTGFTVVKRDGIALSAGFTAPVNVELGVGELSETITVSGASPVVDVQNVRQQTVLTREVMDAIPTGKTAFYTLPQTTPGVYIRGTSIRGSFDVGGSSGQDASYTFIHGGWGGDVQVLNEGLPTTIFELSSPGVASSDAATEETVVGLSGHSAEFETGGVLVNMVPRSGGNAFHSSSYANFNNDSMQWRNVNAAQEAAGVPVKNGSNYVVDFAPTLGGPVKTDRLWFFAAYQMSRLSRQVTMFYDKDPNDFVFTPDTSRDPVADVREQDDVTVRLTWQASQRHKFAGSVQSGERRLPSNLVSGTRPIEGSGSFTFGSLTPKFLGTWTFPVTNRLLIDTAGQAQFQDLTRLPYAGSVFPGVLEQSTGYIFRMYTAALSKSNYYSYTVRSTVSYVTGSHALKVGVQLWPGNEVVAQTGENAPYSLTLLNGAARFVTYNVAPVEMRNSMFKGAVFAQDQWTVKRLTVNAGVRFDSIDTWYPDQQLQATSILPARSFPKADVLAWRDLSPRLGVSYDLFGKGRTAIKASVNRYVKMEHTNLSRNLNPASAGAQGTLQRTWVDANGDFIPQGDPLNPAANGEIGPSTNALFGSGTITTRFDPDALQGWGKREYNWEFTAQVQHELLPRVSLNVGYFRRIFGNQLITDNLAVSPADYDPYCITAPSDSRLPGGGGQQICGLFNINPAKLGARDDFQTLARNYGGILNHYNGVDVTMSARLGGGTLLQGGVSTGTQFTDTCAIAAKLDPGLPTDVPTRYFPSTYLCHQASPYLTQVKFLASHTFPGAIQISGVYQSVPGTAQPNQIGPSTGAEALFVASNASIVPTLGRNLAAGAAANVTLNVLEPGSIYGDRVHQFDLRGARAFIVGGVSLKATVDLYNVFNANPVIEWNNTYGTTGAAWLNPREVLVPRFLKVGMQVSF